VRRVLFDTDVVLAALQARLTHLADSAAVLGLMEAGRVGIRLLDLDAHGTG
jgi:hypothetical protein